MLRWRVGVSLARLDPAPGDLRHDEARRSCGFGLADQLSSQRNEIVEPEGFENDLGVETLDFVLDRLVEHVVARHDGHADVVIVSANSPQESKTIENRHTRIKDDRIYAVNLRQRCLAA